MNTVKKNGWSSMNYWCSTDTAPCGTPHPPPHPASHTHPYPSSAKSAWAWRPLRTQMLPHHWAQVTLAVVVHSLSHVQIFVTLWTAAHQPPLSFTISLSLLKLMSIESVMPPNHLILYLPLLLLPSIFPSIRITLEHLFFLTSVKYVFFFFNKLLLWVKQFTCLCLFYHIL